MHIDSIHIKKTLKDRPPRFFYRVFRSLIIPGTVLALSLVPMGAGGDYGGLRAQNADTGQIEKQLDKLRKNPLIQELLERGKKPQLTPLQREILEKVVASLNDTEIVFYLKKQGLSAEGSIYARRERLKIALGIGPEIKLPEKKKVPSISIENANEGEYMQGEDDERGLLKLRGRIRVKLSQGVVTADRVIVDTKRQEIYAEGNLVYKGKDGTIKAERIIYNQQLGVGILYNADGYLAPIRFIGENLTQVGPGKFALSHAWFTSCAAELPHYSFTAGKVWIHEGKRVIAAGVLYHIAGIPLLPLPFVYGSQWGTGIITQAGVGDLQGFFLQNTYQFSIPEAMMSSWAPMMYRFTLDYYENTGEVAGAEFYKFAPGINYVVQLGGAQFRRYDIISDFRERDSIRLTNQVTHTDGTVGRENYNWYKAFALINAKHQDLARNHVRNVNLRYEGYSHQLYEFEFGGRYQPTSTIPALYENSEAGRGLLRPTTNWNLVYNEQWDDLSLRVEATRNRLWQESSIFADSRYIPVNDVVPSVDLSKRFSLGKIPWVESPLYWYHTIHSDLYKEYSGGKLFKTLNTNRYETRFRSFFSFYPFITFIPDLGYGAQKSTAQTSDTSLEQESQKNSYQYYFGEPELTIGPDMLFLRTIYRRKESFKEELRDEANVNLADYRDIQFENNQKINETELMLGTSPLRNLNLSVTGIYDHRKFAYDVDSKDRWYYPVARLDYTIDFLNFNREGRENLLSRRKLHFLQLRVSDDYVYDSVKKRDHSNVLGLNFQMGGFDLWLLKRLRYLEAGFYWYHVYYNEELDHMRWSFKTDFQITKTIYLELELESRATDIERFKPGSTNAQGLNDYIAFEHDILNSTGINGPRKRQESVFNTGYFETAIILDLHEWEMRFGYALEQKSILAGVNSVEVVNFYDNKFFFSMSLLRFDVGGVGDRPSRFILNRKRVRAQDVGRTGITASN